MSRYVLLFRGDPAAVPEDEYEAMFQSFVDWADALAAEGRYLGSEALTGRARRVGGRGETLGLDGPFAETQEALNGFITVAAADIDEAARVAEGCPGLAYGWSVDVVAAIDIPRPSK